MARLAVIGRTSNREDFRPYMEQMDTTNGVHFYLIGQHKILDLWPSTSKWRVRNRNPTFQGSAEQFGHHLERFKKTAGHIRRKNDPVKSDPVKKDSPRPWLRW